MSLDNFTLEDVAALYQQHTHESGQVFLPNAVAYVFELTQGQPWLVNALAKAAVEEILDDQPLPVTIEHIAAAKELLIQRQDTHLDSLAERLREPRVRRVIEPMLAGAALGDLPADDRQFVVDLGLARRDPAGGLVIANPIYREVIPRVLANSPRIRCRTSARPGSSPMAAWTPTSCSPRFSPSGANTASPCWAACTIMRSLRSW